MTQKFHVATFGCRTNQADSAALRQEFLDRSYLETANPGEADLIVVNSCTVTHRSDQQVRQLTRRLRRDNPSARLLVTGCYAQRAPEELAKIPGVDAVIGNSRKADLLSIAQSLPAQPAGAGELAAVFANGFDASRSLDRSSALQLGGRTRPFVKIQDGCDAKCSYCIIPAVRGPSRSVPPGQVLTQVRRLVEVGFQEIVLTGIHIGTYGQHLRPRFPLDQLVERIAALPGLGRLRISSIEPMELSRRIIDLAASDPRIAPHFHICLQSGCDRILRRMRRPYRTARFAALVESIRRRLPQAAIGTDIIVGFPGETEEDHRESLDFVRRMPFTYLHVFPYSDRSGTTASTFLEKVHPDDKRRRSQEFLRLSRTRIRNFRRSFLGQRIWALTLGESRDGRRQALSDNYIKVLVDASQPENRLVTGIATVEAGDALVLEGG